MIMNDRGVGGDLGSAVLAMTAASAEPADPGMIARWLGLPGEVPHVPGVLTRADGPPERNGHGRSSQAMRRLLDRRLAAAVAAAHGRIADHYLALWGGLADGLPSLAARPELGDVDGGYGLRHLVGHLLKAGRSAEAHRLLAYERPAGQGRPGAVNVWFDARHRAGRLGGYLRDLEAARRAARDAGLPGLGLGLEMRYPLMRVCAERSESRPYGPGRDLLLEAGLWDHVRALNDARREAQGHKGRALLGVLPYVPAGERQDVLHEAVIDAMTRPRAYPSVDEDLLADVAAHLSPEGARRAVAFAAGLEDGGSTVRALITLAPHLPSGAMRDALEAARSLPEEHDRAGALAGLAPFMTEGQAGETLPVALAEAARQVTPEEYVELLAELSPLLPPGDRDEVGADAYAVARTIADEEVRARALVRIAGLGRLPRSWPGRCRQRGRSPTRRTGPGSSLASLERALGGPVLIRGATVRTTALGQEILAHGRAALRACAAIQEASGRHGGRLTGTVRVAAPPTVCHGLLPAFLAEWKSAFPHVRPVVLEGDDEEVDRWLRDSVTDLTVLVDPGPVDGVELGTDRFHALLPADHPLAAEETIEITDLDDDPFILSQGGCEKYVREAYRKAGASIRPAHHVRDMTTLLTMVRSGIGVSVVPELTRPMLDERLVLVPLAQRIARRLVLAGPQDRPWSPAATALARTCSAQPPVLDPGQSPAPAVARSRP
ncbi:LysR substrate-binding domain-containing protein [Actinomadura viridis]|uniref:LysR substrate-binding domain-containing protein n=1 Tax=Actinomadura viridis TaxID=58110 RepID=UPI0036C887DB